MSQFPDSGREHVVETSMICLYVSDDMPRKSSREKVKIVGSWGGGVKESIKSCSYALSFFFSILMVPSTKNKLFHFN